MSAIGALRLPLSPQFGLAAARQWLPCARRLGVSHVSLSPVTEAVPGSPDGLDPTDANVVRAELGGPLQLQLLLGAALAQRLQVIVDVVPNHLSAHGLSVLWQDVLAFGPHSPHADDFDVDWEAGRQALLAGRPALTLPLLPAPLDAVLAAGGLQLVLLQRRLFVRHGRAHFALSPASYPLAWAMVAAVQPPGPPTAAAAQPLLDALGRWQPADRAVGEAVAGQLVALRDAAAWGAALPLTLPPDAGMRLLRRQFWGLTGAAGGRHAATYRHLPGRPDCVALRVEEPRVFAAHHHLVRQLLADEAVAGLCVRHIDQLADPQGYLERLRTLGARHLWVQAGIGTGGRVPASWPISGVVDGRPGCDFAALWAAPQEAEPAAVAAAGSVPAAAAGRGPRAAAAAGRRRRQRCRGLALELDLGAELERLATSLLALRGHVPTALPGSPGPSLDGLGAAGSGAAGPPLGGGGALLEAAAAVQTVAAEPPLPALRHALRCFLAALPRPRTYLPQQPRGEVQAAVRRGLRRAVQLDPSVDAAALDAIAAALGATSPAAAAWAARLQQLAAACAIRGDLIAAARRVAAPPTATAAPLSAPGWHARAAARAVVRPGDFVGSGHGEGPGALGRDALDVRWALLTRHAAGWAAPLAAAGRAGARLPSGAGLGRRERALCLRALVGAAVAGAAAASPPEAAAVPVDALVATVLRLLRASRWRTSEAVPRPAHERLCERFVRDLCADAEVGALLRPLRETVAAAGGSARIGQAVVQATVGGAPWLSVDDVGWPLAAGPEARAQQLAAAAEAALEAAPGAGNVAAWLAADPGAARRHVQARLLRLRAERPRCFAAPYVPLRALGPGARQLLAYARGACVVVLRRGEAPATEAARAAWAATTVVLPPSVPAALHEVLAATALRPHDGRLPAAALPLPWAVLVPADG